MDKIERILKIVFNFLLPIYFVFTAFYFLKFPSGAGDEIVFLKDIEFIKEIGWYRAIVENISIPYMLLSYPLVTILDPAVALRLVNIVVLFFLFYYLHRKNLLNHSFQFLMFYVATAAFYFYGTNDGLFFTSLVIFFAETYLAATRRKFNLYIALTALIICLFTRQLFFVFVPAILIAFYILYNHSRDPGKRIWIPLLLFVFLFCLNIPSLMHNGRISYDRKLPPDNMEVTWTQRQYLAQLMVNKGELGNFQHPGWEETEAYLEKHGRESLPDNIIKGVFQDPVFTLKEFFKDLYFFLIYSSRGVGLILFISIGYFIISMLRDKNLFRKKRFYTENFIPLISIIMISVFSFIIISYLELRWLSPILIMLIIYYGDLLKDNRIDKRVELLNLLYFCSIAIYGIVKLFLKTF